MTRLLLWALGLALAGAPLPADAYIEAMYTLADVVKESEVVAEGVVEKADGKSQVAIVKVTKSHKGKCGYTHIRMNLGGGQYWHPEAVTRHLVVGAPVVIFYNADRAAEAYVNRFFMQLYGDKDAAPEKAWWNFTHVEIRCNRTFNGTAGELSKAVAGIVSGRAKPPAPDPRLPLITKEALAALPPPGQAVTDGQLPAPFKRSAPFRPRTADTPAKTARGVKFESYAGEWQDTPDFAKLTPAKKGVAEKIDLAHKSRDTNIALRFTGFVQVPRDATYIFSVSSAGGHQLLIGKAEVVRKVGFLDAVIEVSGGVDLKAGKHAFTLLFFDAGAGQDLQVSWEGPDLAKEAIPPSALFHAP